MQETINEENRHIWNMNAALWDETMGRDGNIWHKELIVPKTIEYLNLSENDSVLDIGCGNGIFARRLRDMGISVTAIDFSEENIVSAQSYGSSGIKYNVVDATDYDELVQLGKFSAAVANMVLMDIPEIEPLFKALHEMLAPNGVFVFSIQHPCFNSSGAEVLEKRDGDKRGFEKVVISNYAENYLGKGEAIEGQPLKQYYFHRSISTYLECAFKFGFVLDGFHEPVFDGDGLYGRVPPVLIMSVRKK